MSLQVNLLKKTERRYQGIVSMKVMVLGSAGVLIGVTVLILFLAGVSKMTLNANLDRARREWDRLGPLADVVRSAHAATAANKKTLAELDGWAQGDHMAMHAILRAVQSEIPPQMELSNLYAGTEQSDMEQPPYYTLRFSGRAQGELTAVNAKRQLNSNAEIRGFCGEVKLVSSQRETGDVWVFAFEGRRPAGEGGQ